MINQNVMRQTVKGLAFMVLGMLLAVLLLAGSVAGQSATGSAAEANAASAAASNAAPEGIAAPEGEVWITCTPTNVAAYGSRVHVRCAAAVSGIQFFAASTADASHAARILSVLLAAHASGRDLSILYDTDDTSGTAFGCLALDCRVIIAAAMQ